MSAAADATVVAYVGLGANLGDAAATVDAAVHALEALPETSLLRRSARYRTPAWGRTDQPDFVNAVVALRTSLPPAALLQALLAIERRFGRDRDAEHGRWGPRRLGAGTRRGPRVLARGAAAGAGGTRRPPGAENGAAHG